jgi:thiopeptide-type bacteriocin biosynthesis protein
VYRPLPRFLLRAPLLPVSSLWRGTRALLRNRLGADAIRLASPSLARAQAGARRDRALERYARRAAFRPTPHGLLAGVCMGTLADRTEIATGRPAAHLAPSWARMEALARALLDDPELRARTRLRAAPSLVRGAAVVRWLGPGDTFDEIHEAELTQPLPAILAATERWVPWDEVRAAVAATAGGDAGDADELLLNLLDDGLLHSDLTPPLVGAPPGEHVRARLQALGEEDAARALEGANTGLAGGALATGAAALATLPGGGADNGIHGVLVHRPRKTPTLERAAVERAARLVPLLVRLQDALAPPAAERFAQPALADGLDAATELHGAGAFDVAALATGDYGVELHDGDEDLPHRAPDALVLSLLLDAIAEAGRAGRDVATLDTEAVEQALRDVPGPPLPCSAELFLAPAGRRPRQPPGTGWLLGVHAPAGASLGRFGHALGADAVGAIAELEAAERQARPLERSVDVAFAPTPELADLASRPRTARRTLALTRWTFPADDDANGAGELHPDALDLIADPDEPVTLALRERSTGAPVVPASFARLRSRTAPAGIARLLVGWSLWRQHASWALPPGPLANLAHIPRLCVEGFVVAPASWRLPPDLHTAADIRRWRKAAAVPRHVQLGEGDELLPVDLAAPGAAADLADHDRVFEIWPPIDEGVDRDGRRLEAVVMVIERPCAHEIVEHARRSAAIRSAGAIPPPARAPRLDDWRTFKLFGAQGRQDDLLALLLPTIRAAQHAGEIDSWFFQRYVDGPGSRHHLRVRVHAPDAGAFERRMRDRLGGARAAATITSIEIDEYRPEHGRFRADELGVVHEIFESDSELVCALLPPPADAAERIGLLVRALDALAAGLGLDLDARHAAAAARRRAAEASAAVDEEDRARADRAFRRIGRGLRASLATDGDAAGDQANDVAAKLAAHRSRTAHAARGLSPEARARLLPTLLHLAAVRSLGADRDGERLAYTFWERTLQGLRRPAGRSVGSGER